jgi:hypothetical protein
MSDQLATAHHPLTTGSQFFLNSVACGDVLALRFHEDGQQLTGFIRVKAVVFQIREALLLPHDLVFATRNTLLGFLQALFAHPVHSGFLPKTLP